MSNHRFNGQTHAFVAGSNTVLFSNIGLGIRRSIDLETGLTTDAFMEYVIMGASQKATCEVYSNPESALWRGVATPTTLLEGFASAAGRPGFWNQPWTTIASTSAFAYDFDLEANGGMLLLLAADGVGAMLTPGSSAITILTKGDAITLGSGSGVGEGDLEHRPV
jgi:hypothetical protein